MPRSSSVRLIAMARPPDWATIATGPAAMRCERSSVSVISRDGAWMLPMQFGPETARPVSAIVLCNVAASALAAGFWTSPKPDDMTVALRAPAAAAARNVSGTWVAGITTTTWSGGSGSSAKLP